MGFLWKKNSFDKWILPNQTLEGNFSALPLALKPKSKTKSEEEKLTF